jgi:methionyl-tRNA formyltransferase
MINFVFFGTDEFATTILEELKQSDLVPGLIVTTPDSPKGRKLVLTPPPVKIWAQENKLEYLQPEKLSELTKTLTPNNYSLFIVASYGKIIPQSILDLPKHGTLNIHPSLLPKYRGAAPLQSVILNGDSETGVSIMLLDEQMDHGPILDVRKLDLRIKNFNFVELRDELALRDTHLLTNILPDYLSGKLKPVEQDHSQATYTKKITKELSLLDLTEPPELNDRKIRALNPNPGTYFIDDNGKRVKVVSAHIENNTLVLERVVPEAKKEMDWESYLRGKK